MRHAVLLALALCSAGCGRADQEGTSISINTQDGDGSTALDGNSGEVTIDAPGFKGSFTLPKMRLDADSFDLNGVKLPTGSAITGMNITGAPEATAAAGEPSGGVRVSFSSPMGEDVVRDWFRQRLPKAGYTVDATRTGLSGVTQDRKPFRIDVSPAGAGRATGVITIGG